MLMEEQRGRHAPCHIFDGFALEGVLSVPALQAALDDVVEHHEMLRTGFCDAAIEGEAGAATVPRAWVKRYLKTVSRASVPIRQLEQGYPYSEDQLASIARDEYYQAFDLRKPPLIRALLVHTGSREKILFIVVHHLVSDLISMRILRTDLARAYEARGEGRKTSFRPALPYHQYASSQLETVANSLSMRETIRNRHLAWQEDQLRVSDFPFALTPSSVPFGSVMIHLPRKTSLRLLDLAKTTRVTLFALLLTVLAIILGAITKRPRLSLWINLGNRSTPGTELSFGYFVNSQLICVDLSQSLSISDLMVATQQSIVKAIRSQGIPLVAAVKGTPERDSDIRVSFDLGQGEEVYSLGPGLQARRLSFEFRNRLAHFVGLDFVAVNDKDGIKIRLGYRQDKLSCDGARNLMATLRTSLVEIVASERRESPSSD